MHRKYWALGITVKNDMYVSLTTSYKNNNNTAELKTDERYYK